MGSNPSNRSNFRRKRPIYWETCIGKRLGIRGSAAKAVVDGFPVRGVGREIYRDPAVIFGIGLMENFVERGSVLGCPLRHLADGDVGTAGRMLVLQVNSFALVGQFSIRR